MCEHDVEYKANMFKKVMVRLTSMNLGSNGNMVLWRGQAFTENKALSDNPFNVRSSKIKDDINRNMYLKSSSKDINNQVATQEI